MLYQLLVRREDERGRQDAQVLIEADTIDEAQETGLEFARGDVFFGIKAEYVEWLQCSNVELPFVMHVNAPVKLKSKKRK